MRTGWQSTKRIRKAAPLVAAAVMTTSLAGCGAPAAPQNQVSGAGAPAQSSTQTANLTPTNEPSTNRATSGALVPQNAAASDVAQPSQSALESLILDTMSAARQGKLPGIPFRDQMNIEQVSSAWGKPSQMSGAGAGVYATYASRGVAFGLNQGDQIFDVRSYASLFRQLTYGEIVGALGAPGTVRYTQTSYIYLYPAGPEYQLLWVFPRMKDGSRGPTVDHVSVFWPRGTIDMMAATQPAPSVAIDRKPVAGSNSFTFHIVQAPKGYQLEELIWLPSHGDAVVNTWTQAVARAAAGATNPGFLVSPSHSTFTFRYSPEMRGQTGQVEVIYQATSGAAMIGNSPSFRLE